MKTHTYYTFTIFLYSQFVNTENIKLLLIDPSQEITEEQEGDLRNLWYEIFYTFLEDKGDKETKANFDIIMDLLEMEKDYEVVRGSVILYGMPTSKQEKDKLVEVLKKYGLALSSGKETRQQIQKIERYLKILEANIRQLKLQNDDLFKKVVKKIKINIFDDIASMHKVTGLKLDPMKTTLPEWASYLKMAKSVNNV